MNVHIDKAGRLVLPKAVRQQLGITPPTSLELVLSGDGVLLRRVAELPPMRQVGELWVHQGVGAPGIDSGKVVDDIRDGRADAAWHA